MFTVPKLIEFKNKSNQKDFLCNSWTGYCLSLSSNTDIDTGKLNGHVIYVVHQESNETGAIFFLFNIYL